jgi:DNA-binding HxlR family transcriptional regulator
MTTVVAVSSPTANPPGAGAGPVCGMDVVLEVLGAKWKTRILCALDERPHRFGELRRAVGGVSEKVLTQQLRDLAVRGVVARVDHGELPLRVEYRLTASGRELLDALAPLGRWAQQWDARAAG